MIPKEEAEDLVKEKVDNENLRNHMYAVSSIMEKLGEELGKNPEKWARIGLLHDVDYEETKDNPKEHALRSAEILEDKLSNEALKAIKSHNHKHTGVEPENDVDNALIAADAISGLIVATALVMPNKTLEEVRAESVQKKFDDSSFAKNIDRDRIMYCKEVGLDREEFIELTLEAMKGIDEKLGLA
ncbi:MAG: HDIG domain-containing protein [Candidatus Nanohaloarchaeota archaeon QJJ-9]|nr:HDIG domain-containing protein [Candidatus Nanohaloarchaeota archaeon QJJ-9]